MRGALAGRTIVVTREHTGQLDTRLAALGAAVVHVPTIEVVDADDGGAALSAALADIDRYDWLVVTSPNGARRITVTPGPSIRLAAVGRATAETLAATAGRRADLVPSVQRLDGLLSEFPPGGGRVLTVRGDRADPALVAGLEELGWEVDDVVAYRTVDRLPSGDDRARAEGADAVVFASGSAAAAWAAAFASWVPGDVVTIGPSTTAVAERSGLAVTAEAPSSSVDGLIAALVGLYR